jgi:hypothetical protein
MSVRPELVPEVRRVLFLVSSARVVSLLNTGTSFLALYRYANANTSTSF